MQRYSEQFCWVLTASPTRDSSSITCAGQTMFFCSKPYPVRSPQDFWDRRNFHGNYCELSTVGNWLASNTVDSKWENNTFLSLEQSLQGSAWHCIWNLKGFLPNKQRENFSLKSESKYRSISFLTRGSWVIILINSSLRFRQQEASGVCSPAVPLERCKRESAAWRHERWHLRSGAGYPGKSQVRRAQT